MDKDESGYGPFSLEDRAYIIHYDEAGKARWVIGNIKFFNLGGICVRMLRGGRELYIPRYIKVEEATQEEVDAATRGRDDR